MCVRVDRKTVLIKLLESQHPIARAGQVVGACLFGRLVVLLLARLPWLLQPGVDTLIIDQSISGQAYPQILADTLEVLSPATLLKWVKTKD